MIEREAGRGAMGIVYLARDTRLGRQVALKALPEHLAADAARLERLEREARMLASLNHPNIASIYSLEEHAGRLYLVLEWAPGQPLESRLRQGPLEAGEAASLCHQVARALQAAHGSGIVHRDLKPANVMVGPNGSVKVLDFGLAKSLTMPEASISLEAGPETIPPPDSDSSLMTQVGAILGTPGYMSPEQVRGEAADARSDLWALACILYESLAGQRSFHGQTLSETLVATLEREPDYAKLPPMVPEAVRELLRACLSKDASQRPRDAGAAVTVLERWLADVSRRDGGAAGEHSHNLPADLTSFIGRRRQLADLRKLIEENRLVTLVGVGGCGKTRLSRRAAREALDRFSGGVWFVELAALSDPEQVPQAIAAVLSVRPESPAELVNQIARRVGQTRTLLILDNCEHLLEACARVAHQLLEACPELHILASSREGMAVPGEAIYAVPPLSLPQEPEGAGPITPEELLKSDATALFVERARAAGATLELTPATACAVNRICRRLDGIPLAIELAAARLKAMTAEQLEARLDDAFRLLTGGSRTALPRHRTLRATIDWSYNLLSEREKRLLRRLTVFRGGWSLEAAEAICADPDDAAPAVAGEGAQPEPIGSFDLLDLLSALVEKSLVIREPVPEGGGELRYRLLETIRQYAAETWSAEGGADAQAVRNRHLDYFAELAEQGWWGVQGTEQAKWIRRMRLDLENAIAAVNWCESAPDGTVKELRLLRHLGLSVWNQDPSALGLELCRRALARDPSAQPARDRGMLLNQFGLLLHYAGDPSGEAVLLEAIETLKRVGERLWLAHAYNDISLPLMRTGSYEEACRWLELALAEAPPEDTRLVTIIHCNLAQAEIELNNLDRAQELLTRGFSLVEPHDLRWRFHLTRVSFNLSMVKGELDAAVGHLRQLTDLSAKLNTVQNWIWTLPAIIQFAAARSEWESLARIAGGLHRLRTAHGIAPVPPSDAVIEARRQLGEERYEALASQGASTDTHELCLRVLERLMLPPFHSPPARRAR